MIDKTIVDGRIAQAPFTKKNEKVDFETTTFSEENVKTYKDNGPSITKAPSLFSSISDKKIDIKIEKETQPIKYNER